MNAQKYLENFNVKPIFEKILQKYNISSMENNYTRHFQELKKKYLSLIAELVQKTYFNEMPLYLDEPLLYVIILNAPFMEEEKRAKYNTYLQKKTVADFKDNVKEFIYPYKNSDKDKLGKGAILILKMDSVDSAKKAALALNGVFFLKSNQVIAMTYPEYEKIAKLPKTYEEKKQLEFENVNQWEKSNFTEMLLVESKDKITVGTIHFLKKTFTVNYTLPNNKEINEVNWSPQGKFLVITKDDKIVLYGGENDQPINELNIHSHNYNISNDENYILNFSGYKDEKKDDKEKEDTKSEKSETTENTEKSEADEKDDNVENVDNVFLRNIANDDILRAFAIKKNEKFSNFIWSPDSNFIGRIKGELLIVYELSTMKMIYDAKENKRMPIKNGIKKFSWFPNNNILIAISENYDSKNKKKLISSTLDFMEIPSKETFPHSSLANSNIVDLVWHKNNHLLAILSKEVNKSIYSVRLIDFNIKNKTYSSSNCKLPVGTKEKPLISMQISWMGDTLFVVPKFKDITVESISIYPYNLNIKNLELEQCPAENCYDNLKHSHFIPSPNGINFLLACMDKNNTNNYGKCDLYVLHGQKMSFCKATDMGSALSKLEWDHDGRLCIVELNYGKEKEGYRIINCLGDTIYEEKDLKLSNISWRPRHKPLLNEYNEEKDIENNLIKVSKFYEDEDAEFLSSHEKKQRALDKEVYDKFTSVMKRRLDRYNKDTNKKEIKEEKKINHDFWIEEILKGEEFIVDSQEY